MTYNDDMAKRVMDVWAELYTFTVGAEVTRYTSHSQDVPFDSETYKARPISRREVQSKDQIRPDQVRFSAPLDEIMLGYIANAPVEPVVVEIRRVVLATGNNKVIFRGEVVDVTLKENTASVVAEAKTDTLRNEFPPLVYQTPCQWLVFDGDCGLLESNFEEQATVTLSADGTVLTSSTFGLFPDDGDVGAINGVGYFTLGFVRFGEDFRHITAHVGNTIKLLSPFDARLQNGNVVRAYPGCDNLFNTCEGKFSNTGKFSGCRFIPSNNPALTGFK